MADPGHKITPYQTQDDFQVEVSRALDETARVSYFSTSNGPNQSALSSTFVEQGTLGIDMSESASTVAWIAHRAGGSNWSEMV